MCVEDLTFCPITNFLIRYDPNINKAPILKYAKAANSLPLLKIKISENQPCLRPSYYNSEQSRFFDDEIRSGLAPCPKSDYFDTLTDPRWF